MIRVFSRGIRRIPHLATFLGEPVTWGSGTPEAERAVAGWGLRPSARRAIDYAERNGLPYLALEDGFLRSVFPGPTDPPLSLCVDDLGIYYDASRPSRLERLIATPLSEQQSARARALIEAWRSGRVSKYNHQREYEGDLPRPYVLVIDQTQGDASITHGLTTTRLPRRSGLQTAIQTFHRMLHSALENHPDCTIILKVHPDVIAKRKRGHFDLNAVRSLSRVKVLADHAHPARLLEEADAVYTVTSQMGFEALLWNRPVRTFGMPFYAGWGLTEDTVPAPERRGQATLEKLAYAALIAYPRYVHPETGERCDAEDVLAHLALQRRMRQRLPETVYAAGFSPYKRPLVRRFCGGSEVRFVRSPEAAPAEPPLLVWGTRPVPDHPRVIRLEDGFLRSVGLGADLIRPISWVLDDQGIHYDATRPSTLEHIRQTTRFDGALLDRAR
ncbi:MAG TPA: capsular polysaccharide biosynthesis protein, partial [Pseudomonadales bacterium]